MDRAPEKEVTGVSCRESRRSLDLEDAALLRECDVDTFRGPGPGGQKRNKTSSGVRLRHRPTGLCVTAVEERSQHVNKARAVRRLRRSIALTMRCAIDPAQYSPGSELRRCISPDGGIDIGRRDRRYWSGIAEILDVFAGCEARLAEASRLLKVRQSALVRLFARDPKLWERVNQMRTSNGLKALRPP